ncbi:tRNA uridine-5-carboxymethylaminomethyl(34) synthesis GTPase MnmE, partial [Halomonas sp. MG34]|nr:tRNA uridine-5-carboxymethylaminomethyl(34) synthesis GTPase MnmE [Halomonas sp. MG34]
EKLFEAIQGLEYIVIINKTDLEQNLDLDSVKELAEGNSIVTTSLLVKAGIDKLEQAIADTFFSGEIDTCDLTYVSNIRHIQLLKQAKEALEEAMQGLEMNMPLDIVQIDVTRTWEFLGEIIGDTASDSLIDQLFSQFCLGK